MNPSASIGQSERSARIDLVDAEAATAILASHGRSRAFGLDPERSPEYEPLPRAQLSDMVARNQALYQHAMPVMESLYENILNTHSMVLLTDANGMILHALGDDDFLQRANKVALAPGVEWSERSRGTNAIGTAIAAAEPTVVHADQHYLRANHFLTCSAVPIVDPRGDVCGVLDVTGDFRSYHQHTMALVRMSGQIIENQLFSDTFPDAVRVHFHNRPEFIGTMMEGIAAFDLQGRFLGANRSALSQFGLGKRALEAHTFSSLFGAPMSTLMEYARGWKQGPLQSRLYNGLIAYVRAELRKAANIGGVDLGGAQTAPRPAAQAQRPAAPKRLSSLHYLDTGDPQAAAAIAKVRKVLDRDIPIMIVGETGTGKELLAQAIHHDSARGAMPMVAVNCASIPDTLIESELFGYVDGAFTGARKRGQPGKILAANGGTLFLDEIGDMPLALQARLLRVLQERVVTPLGGHQSIPVNVMVICATHRNLRELVAQGQFREDLYYRLNGLVVKLPALRERTDLRTIIDRILAAEAHEGAPFALDEEVADLFARYRWPGNFRQLDNALRAAKVMADADHVIRREHLSDDLLDELIEPCSATSARPAIAPPATVAPETLAVPAVPTQVPSPTASPAGATSLDAAERALIQRALETYDGNVSAVARVLGVSRNTIYRKMERMKAG